MYGIQRQTTFAKQTGAYVARAIEIAAEFERNISRGALPPSVTEAAIRAGFDDK